jgi:hypothetical protein
MLLNESFCFSQGFNHSWLLGLETILDTNTTSTKARLNFDSTSVSILQETRKMAFWETQGNISDASGNFLMSSNGVWIANSTGDTMLNGSGLNPNSFTSGWTGANLGLPLPYGNVFLPFPGDSTKYVLFHQTGNYNANLESTEVFYSIIDLTLDGGFGGVTQKNVIAFQDTLSWGITACKHANGRDWWIVALKDSSTIIYKILFTPNGIASIATQNLNFPLPFVGNAGQPTFSPDGTKFAYTSGRPGMNPFGDVRIFSFDRCSGMFDTLAYVPRNNDDGFGVAFSANSKYLYHSMFGKVYQLNTDTTDIPASDTLIALYDGYVSPYNHTNFWLMYRAANGKIYISSGAPVLDLHVINYPDSAGLSCDLQQHSFHLPCYHVGGVPNHPNYYLSSVSGSICDSLGLGVSEILNNFHFNLYPNPVTEVHFNISYLPQNKEAKLEIFDVTGKCIYQMQLPMWSTLQEIELPSIANGLYQCVLTSGNERESKTIAVMKD